MAKFKHVVLFLLLGLLLLLLWGCGEIPDVSPPQPQGQVDPTELAALEARITSLQSQGIDVSAAEEILADIEFWLAQGKDREASIRLTDLRALVEALENGTLTPTIQVPSTPTPPPEPAPAYAFDPVRVLFADDFDSEASLANWSVVDLDYVPEGPSGWRVVDGRLYEDMAPLGTVRFFGTMAVAGAEDWEDYRFSANIYPTGNVEVGVAFRVTDQSYYLLRILKDDLAQTPKLLLERQDEEGTTLLAAQDGPGYQVGRWSQVVVTAVGEELQVELDGQLLFAVVDSELPRGKIGLYCFAMGDVVFDSVTVVRP